MRIRERLLDLVLGLFIAGMLALPAHAQDIGADVSELVRQTGQLVQRWAAIDRRLQNTFAACDRRGFDRALVELRVLQDVVEGINRRLDRRDQALREELKRVGGGGGAVQAWGESRPLSFAGSLRLWQERAREFERRCRPFDPSRNHVVVFLEGGASFGHSTLAVDPGAFVPVNETLGFGQGFVGGGVAIPISLTRPASTTFALNPAVIFGANARGHFGDGASRSFNNGVVSGDVRHSANWSATGYVGFPQFIDQPTGLPFIQTLIITPTVGVTYQEDTLKSVQTFGAITNTFEQTFGRTGATVGLNVDVPAGNFSYGLTTGLTMLPSTTVNGTSSLGLPAQAKIDSQANFFVGGRVGVNLTDFQAPRTYRVDPGFRF